MYSKFYNLNNNVLHHLFRTYTSSFYGIEIWYDQLSNRTINKLSVCYHKALKKVAHLNVWDSNHLACDIVNVPIFKHLAAKRALCFLISLISSQSPCIAPFKSYFKYSSNIKTSLSTYFNVKYNIVNLLKNPLCAVIARIQYVQRHEPRSSYRPSAELRV